ncbi:MAG: TldD/PmbA family protein [Chloroflexi bacterium]|nr:TldD/PmbA family protein [Chloroflexota bacterium]
MLQEVLERALKVAEQAEVYCVSSVETPAHFEANHLKRLETIESQGIALRIVRNGRIGFASTTNLSDLQGLVNRAVEVSSFGAESRLDLPGKMDYPEVPVYDPDAVHVTGDDLAQLGQGLIDALRAENPDVLCEGTASKTVSTTTILNSKGCSLTYTQSNFEVSLEGTVVEGTDMLFVYDTIHSGRVIRDTGSLLRSVTQQLTLGRRVAQPISGLLPVIFTPRGVSGAMLWPLTSAFNGRSVIQGTSPLTGRLGERIVDERVTLWDDPTVPYTHGSGMADDEGIPSRRLPLVQRGVAANFLYDLQTAGMAKRPSTGSATRWSLGMAPLPSASVTVMEPGNSAFEDMVKDVKKGIIVESMLGAGQSNILAGDFSGNVLMGYCVEDGKIVGRAKDTVISGNVYEVLNNLAGIGLESRWIWGRLSAPAIYCKSVSVSAKEA